MNQIHKILQQAAKGLGDLLDESGSILYSSIRTLTKGDFYLVGTNPGGSDGLSIRNNLENLSTNSKCEYKASDWVSNGKAYRSGEHPLQKRLIKLFKEVDQDIEDVCASNLIFLRSRTVQKLNTDHSLQKLAAKCWPIHEALLQIVQPKYIITFGNLPYSYIAKRLKMQEVATKPSGHGNWTIRISQSIQTQTSSYIIGLPHLSRYAPSDNLLKGIIYEYK